MIGTLSFLLFENLYVGLKMVGNEWNRVGSSVKVKELRKKLQLEDARERASKTRLLVQGPVQISVCLCGLLS